MTDELRRFLATRKRDYEVTFSTPEGKRVLRDLARFCRANHTPYHPEHDKMLVTLGRQEVWDRINRQINLRLDQIEDMLIDERKPNV